MAYCQSPKRIMCTDNMKLLGHPTEIIGRIASLPPDEGVVVHSSAAHPSQLAAGMAEGASSLRGRRVYALMPYGALPYADAPARDQLELAAFLPGAGLRRAMDAGRVVPLRMPLSSIPAAIAARELKVGAVLLRVSPPDASGRVSLGVSVDYMPEAIAAARFVFAEIDPLMPRPYGAAWMDARRIDGYMAAIDTPHAVPSAAADEIDRTIADHVASLVEDGATLQLGVGSLPDRVLAQLEHHRHMGLHTGIIGDGERALIERGVIDNSRKRLFTGVSVATMAVGSAALYRFVDANPLFEMHPCATTHSADVLRRLDTLCAINSALQVDLEGQVNAEWAGSRQVSLPGGLTDFARAASSLPKGRSIIALRATHKSGASNIVARLAEPKMCSLTASEVDFVVTEHGVASLRGASASERCAALIAVAAPEHREALRHG